jgi:hypothetical protein
MSEWVTQQLRKTFSQADPYPCVIFDYNSKFNVNVIDLVRSTFLQSKRTSIQAPRQNGVAERWIGSCRREMLNHIIPLNEAHLWRFLRVYATYYNEDRLRDALKQRCTELATVGAKAVTSGDHHNVDGSAWRFPSSLSLETSRVKKVFRTFSRFGYTRLSNEICTK